MTQLDFSVPAGNSYGPRALAVHPRLNRAYARTYEPGASGDDPGRVTVLDLATGQVLAVVETGPDAYAEGDVLVDRERDRVYALNPADSSASVLDAGSFETVTTLEGVDQLAIDEDAGRLYAAGVSRLRALDAATYEDIAEVPLPYYRYLALGVDPAAGRLYLAHEQAAGGSYALGIFDAERLDALATVPLPGRPQDLLPVPGRGHVYVTLDDGERDLLWKLSTNGERLGKLDLGAWTQTTHLALDSDGGRLFLSRDAYRQYAVVARDLETGEVLAEVALDAASGPLAWDPTSGRVVVSQTYANRVMAVDPGGTAGIAILPTAVQLLDVAVDQARGYLLVTDTAGRLHVLEGDGSREVARLPAEGEIAVDSTHGRFYTGGQGAVQVRIFDAERLEQTDTIKSRGKPVADPAHNGLYLVRSGVYPVNMSTLTTTTAISGTLPQNPGFSPNPAAVDALVDPDSGRILVLINNGVPGSNNGNYLYVYEPPTFERIFADMERSPTYLDTDPTGDRAYVSRIHIAGQSTSLLEDGRAYTARLDAVFGSLRVDPGLGYLYLSITRKDTGQLLVLDAANLDLLGSVPIPGQYALRALAHERHLLYLANQDGQVQIWSATGGELPTPPWPAPAALPIEEAWRLYLAPASSGEIGALFAGSLYRSDDEGNSWAYLGEGLPDEGVAHVAVSPAFQRDETLFVALSATASSLGIWKSEDGGRAWRMANRGLSDLAVTGLALSPDFARDGALFALTRRQGLFRSTDGGGRWERLTDRYLPQNGAGQLPLTGGVLALSPTYGEDSTLFVAHDGLQRSTDGGETWTRVLGENPASLALAPGFVENQVAYGWFGDAGLLRSGDGGRTWRAMSDGLFLNGYGSGRILLPPNHASSRILYLLWTPSSPDDESQIWRSPDAGATWQRAAGPPLQATTRLELAPDGSAFVALDGQGRLVRAPVDEITWQPPALPALETLPIESLVIAPNPEGDVTLYAVSRSTGILHSTDRGLTWQPTGYPLRHTQGKPGTLLVSEDGTLLTGTPLGLYLFEADAWSRVDGGLPSGEPVSGLAWAADSAIHLLAGDPHEGLRAFLSTDGGRSWSEPLPPLPIPAIAED
ncbi:MAG: hypothetical protein PVG11_00430, partial [Anaerolineae bacterium]